VLAASLDVETYSSARGNRAREDQRALSGSMMIWMDPPDHTRMRKLVSRAFSPQRIAALETEIRHIAAGYWIATSAAVVSTTSPTSARSSR
jgi:cytochrome P450